MINQRKKEVLEQAETSRQTAGGNRGVNTRAETAARAKDTTLKQTSSTKLGGIIFAGSRQYHSVTTGYTAGQIPLVFRLCLPESKTINSTKPQFY